MGLNYSDLFIALYVNSNLASTVNLISVIFLNYKVIFFKKIFYLGVTVTNGNEQLEGKLQSLQPYSKELKTKRKKIYDELGNFRAKKNTKTVTFRRFDFCGGYNK